MESAELNKIGTAEELKIASLRQDGMQRKPVIIWMVRVGDDLYVRSVTDTHPHGSVVLPHTTRDKSKLGVL